VLYETVFFDKPWMHTVTLSELLEGIVNRRAFKYTRCVTSSTLMSLHATMLIVVVPLMARFLICPEADVRRPSVPVERLSVPFPKLSAVVTIGRANDTIPHALHLHLLRPIHCSTILGEICAMPIHHASFDGSDCDTARSIDRIRQISLHGTGRLLPSEDGRDEIYRQISIRLKGTRIRDYTLGVNHAEDHVDTVLELAKVVRQQQWPENVIGALSQPEVRDGAAYTEFYLVMLFHEEELLCFLEKVCD
jgi:hypothetical protein